MKCNLSMEEKLALIEEANRLRTQYFSLLDYKNYICYQRERFLQQVDKTDIEYLTFLNPILQQTFIFSKTFQSNELFQIFEAIIKLLTDFQSEFADKVLKKLNSLQIYFEEVQNEKI